MNNFNTTLQTKKHKKNTFFDDSRRNQVENSVCMFMKFGTWRRTNSIIDISKQISYSWTSPVGKSIGIVPGSWITRVDHWNSIIECEIGLLLPLSWLLKSHLWQEMLWWTTRFYSDVSQTNVLQRRQCRRQCSRYRACNAEQNIASSKHTHKTHESTRSYQ